MGAAALTALGVFTGCGSDAPRTPTEALRVACGADAEVERQDPSPEDGYDLEQVGVGRTELVTAECGDGPYPDTASAAGYDRDPTADMVDKGKAYADADGSSVSWAVLEPRGLFGGEWVVVYGASGDALDRLEELGYERGGYG